MLITISEHIKDAEDAYIVNLQKDKKDQKESERKTGGVAYLESRRESSFPGYRKTDPLDVEPTREYRDPLRSGYNSTYRSSTLSDDTSRVSISKVLLADDNDD